MWLFVHRPFEVWPWLGDLRVEHIYMLGTVFYWALAMYDQYSQLTETGLAALDKSDDRRRGHA